MFDCIINMLAEAGRPRLNTVKKKRETFSRIYQRWMLETNSISFSFKNLHIYTHKSAQICQTSAGENVNLKKKV